MRQGRCDGPRLAHIYGAGELRCDLAPPDAGAGAGKTYTLGNTAPDAIGMIPRAAAELFAAAEADADHTYRVAMSYIQIYMELIQDLLNPASESLVRGPLAGPCQRAPCRYMCPHPARSVHAHACSDTCRFGRPSAPMPILVLLVTALSKRPSCFY